ncbi:MAG: bifunctional diaminohydroxyphosphoribosylaminopyrimidine deaminase/5-amino-6-(5-phosphoribosylamino)uracil reductase RibD [Eubacteriaceae bacterium]
MLSFAENAKDVILIDRTRVTVRMEQVSDSPANILMETVQMENTRENTMETLRENQTFLPPPEQKWMKLAVRLACRGQGMVSPNPAVGAVIVKDGKVIGSGWHTCYGKPHAEREALAACTEDPAGADLYVTLEPCCHTGKTPPCTDAILEAGIGRVITGSSDPKPHASGKGIQILRAAGVPVFTGFMETECDALNPGFMQQAKTGLPYLTLKYAMTADGKTAAASGESKWITSEQARDDGHRYRGLNDAVIAGIGTVLQDDPLLTARTPGMKEPLRIICDSKLRIPEDSRLVSTAASSPVLVATGKLDASAGKKAERLEAGGVHILELPDRDGRVDLNALFRKLGEKGILSVYCEGGGTLAWGLLEAGLVSEVITYIAPKLFGGAGSRTPVGGSGVAFPDDCFHLGSPEVSTIGPDIKIVWKTEPGNDKNGSVEFSGQEQTSCLQES